jgi:hypothetical protein
MIYLPYEILFEIMGRYLSGKDIFRLSRVNRHLYHLIHNGDFGYLWRYLYQRDISTFNIPDHPRDRYLQIMTEFNCLGRHKSMIADDYGINILWEDNSNAITVVERVPSPRDRYYPQIEYIVNNDYERLLDKILTECPSMSTYVLICAAKYSKEDLLDQMIKQCSESMFLIESRQIYNYALREAIITDNLTITEKLLRRGANDIKTAISIAKLYNRDKILLLLLEY